MYYVKKILICVLVLTTLHFYLPGIAVSGDIILSSSDNITTHRPESVSTPEKDIPAETTVAEGKGSKSWLWVAIAVIAVAGAAGAGSGGGSGGGNNESSTGSINVSW